MKKETIKFDAQLFGKTAPPLYGIEDILTMLNKITDVDEQINALMIKRETYVEDLKQQIKKMADSEDKA